MTKVFLFQRLTPWSRALLEKLPVAQLLENFPMNLRVPTLKITNKAVLHQSSPTLPNILDP
jgi:hypothetical protein